MFHFMALVALAGGERQADLSGATYADLKSGGVERRLERLDVEADVWLEGALKRRGHNGDQAVLMGCDLTDPKADQERRMLKRLMRSSDRADFERAETEPELSAGFGEFGPGSEPQGDEIGWDGRRRMIRRFVMLLGIRCRMALTDLLKKRRCCGWKAMCLGDVARSERLNASSTDGRNGSRSRVQRPSSC